MSDGKSDQQAAYNYLSLSDREFDAGNNDEGAVFLYQAVSCAMKSLAKARYTPIEDEEGLHSLANRLDLDHGTEGWHFNALAAACALHDNAQFHDLDYGDLLNGRQIVRELVHRVVGYGQEKDDPVPAP